MKVEHYYKPDSKTLREEPQVFTRWIDLTIEQLQQENKQLKEQIDKAIKYIKEYGRDKQLEEEYLMSAYNLAMYNISLLEILGDKENE